MLRGQAIGGPWRAREPINSGRVVLRPLDLVELIISHTGFRVGLGDGQRTNGAALAAAKSFRAIVGVADLGQVQASIAPAYVAAHEQWPKGLAQGAEAVGNAREGADHATRLEPSGGQQRINVLPAVLASLMCQIEQTGHRDSESLPPQLAEARRAVVS